MAQHSQRPDKSNMVCTRCSAGKCEECVDILRMVYTDKTICTCTRQGHSGEPRDQQILDPDTGAVHAPGMVIDKDGGITRG